MLLATVASLALACGSQAPGTNPSPAAESPAPWWPVASGTSAATWKPTMEPTPIDEPLPHVFGGSQATAVVEFRGSLLAFGNVNGGCCDASFSTDTHAVVWRSADGRSWTLQAAGPELALGEMTAVAASSDRVVVVGVRNLRAQAQDEGIDRHGAVWTSEDGWAWGLVPDVPEFSTVVATATGFVAASNAQAFPELWWSETGSSWRSLGGLGELGMGRIDRLLATPIGIFGVGSTINPEAVSQPELAADAPAAVWRSSDGQSWARLPSTAMFAGASMRDVAWSDGRLLAVGSGGTPARPAFWTSTDGDSWDRIDAPGVGDASSRATDVIGASHGFAVAGAWSSESDESAFGAVVWTTGDGMAWQRATEVGELEINGLVLLPGGGVAVVGRGWSAVVQRAVPLAWTIAPAA